MTRWLWLLPLAVFVGFCPRTASVARGQAPAPVIAGPVVSAPAPADHCAGQVTEDAGAKDGHAPTHERRRWFRLWHKPHPLQNAMHTCLNNHGLGCYATHDSAGCTSLHAELTFIFGSCRQFFGEPCFPGPLPPPYPGAAPGPGGCPNGCP
jgi:hypothetical protein